MWSDDNVHDPLGSWINNHVLLDHIQGRTIWFAAVNTLIPEQICWKFADNIFTSIFQNENRNWSFFPKVPMNNKAAIGSEKGLTPNKRQAITWPKFYDVLWYPPLPHDYPY